MKNKYLNRLLAWLLALAMCTAIPPVGLAEDALDPPVEEQGVIELSDDMIDIGGVTPPEASDIIEEHESEDEDAPPIILASAVSALLLSADSVTLGVKETFALAATCNGEAVKPVYSSSNTKVVTVSEGGKLTAKKTGNAVITATFGDDTAECAVTVLNAPSKVKLSASSVTLGAGEAFKLNAALPSGSASAITWKINKSHVAKVEADGTVTALAKGEAVITAKAFNGKKATCKLKVKAAPSGIAVSESAVTLSVGQRLKPAVSVTGDIKDYTLTSDGAAVQISGDTLIAAQIGRATVTAATYNGLTAPIAVTVVSPPESVAFPEESYTIGVSQKLTLEPVFDPDAPVDLKYTSLNTSVASVTAGGVVSGKKAGKTTITVMTHNGLTATCQIQVYKSPSKVTLNKTSLSLSAGDTYALKAALPANTMSALSWKSSAPKIATVDDEGNVTAVAKGTATITVTTSNSKKATCKVKVAAAAAKPATLTLTPDALWLSPYEYCPLVATLSTGASASVTYVSSDASIAYVSKNGVVTGIRGGVAVITATTADGLTAQCQVVVSEPATAPAAPASLSLSAPAASTLKAAWPASSGATGYRVYIGRTADPEAAALYCACDWDTTQATLRGLSADTLWHVFVTAFNDIGECAISAAAHAQCQTSGNALGYAVALNYTSIMLDAGESKTLTAEVTPDGYSGHLTWSSNAGAVVLAGQSGTSCKINAEYPGSAWVSVTLEDGISTSAFVQVVDADDISDQNFVAVQKALLKEEALLNEDEGGNVIWDMIAAKLTSSNVPEATVSNVVAKLKTTEDVFRDIYVFAMGVYDVVGNAIRDKRGYTISVSQFILDDNTLYLKPQTSTAAASYAAMHETGHAVDFNAADGMKLASENDEANAAVIADVTNLLYDRIDEACAAAGVSAKSISADKVVSAVMDYRTLKNEADVLSKLTANEKAVYNALIDVMEAEMNSTLPMNNGTMVWDAIEGATNFAVSGKFGHSYMLTSSQYREQAYYYYYDKQGNPTIAVEPWAEFYSAKIMQDATTLAINLAYLPQTCQYFTDVLAPQILTSLKDLLKSK